MATLDQRSRAACAPQQKGRSQSVSPSSTLNLLVSLPNDASISALLAKVEADFSRKQPGSFIKGRQLLVEDFFEIVDVAHSQVQAYLTDMMHVTVLATVASQSDQQQHQNAAVPKKEKKEKKEKKVVVPEKKTFIKRQLSSSISLSSEKEDNDDAVVEAVKSNSSSKVVKSASASELSVAKVSAEDCTPAKRAKKSADDTGTVSKPVATVETAKQTPAKQPAKKEEVKKELPVPKQSSADEANETQDKKESKNQRRKRERKENNKLTNKVEKATLKTALTTATPGATTKGASKDGKIKSKNFNLFADLEALKDKQNSEKHVSSSDDEEENDRSDAVSEKLKKQIAASINSYSLEKASQDGATSPKPRNVASSIEPSLAEITEEPIKKKKASATKAGDVSDEISGFSDDDI